MKKSILLLALFLHLKIVAQTFTEDKNGYSSIQIPIGNVGINSEGALNFNYTFGFASLDDFIKGPGKPDRFSSGKAKEFDSVYVKKGGIHRWIFGIGASGESENGVQSIFSKGDFVAGAKMQGLFGVKFSLHPVGAYSASEHIRKTDKVLEEKVNEQLRIKKNNEDFIKNFMKANRDVMVAKLELFHFEKKTKNDSAQANLIRKKLDTLKNNKGNDLVIEAATDTLNILLGGNLYNQEEFKINGGTVKSKFDTLYKKIKQALNAMKEKEKEIIPLAKNKYNVLFAILNTYNPNKKRLLSLYISGERSSREFTLLVPSGATPDEMYKDKTYDGFLARLGINYSHHSKWIIGASIGIQSTDNYDSLSNFKHESKVVVYKDSLREDVKNKTISGKKGNYYLYQQYPLMIDYLYLVRTETDILGFNPYFRYNIIAKNDFGLQSNKTYGLGFYYFKKEKSAFVLGLYAEYNTARQQTDKREWQQRMSLGVLAKLNLTPLSIGKF